MKILVCGVKGSGKSTLAEPFAQLVNGVWINRPAASHYELRHLADGVVLAGKIAVVDSVCAMEYQRAVIDADYVVWMDAVERGVDFEPLSDYNYNVAQWFDDTPLQLSKVVKSWMEHNV